MNRLSIKCRLCNGTGRVEEFTCPCCLGSGTFEKPLCPQAPSATNELCEVGLEHPTCPQLPERPRHTNLFNTTPEYAMSKARRLKTKRQRNTVALCILGLSDFHLESDEREGA